MERSGRQKLGVLVYHGHQLSPEDFLFFYEMNGFSRDWEDLGLNLERDMEALQGLIMARPKIGAVVPETGGLRKMQFAPVSGLSGKKRGKRNACRVCYVYFEEFFTVLLVAAYAKGRKDDLSHEEKAAIRSVIARIHRSIAARYSK